MVQASKTLRIFVSSTFSDLKAERNPLQERVCLRLLELCMSHGWNFQAIHLRWGVSEEAGLDQRTMRICLGEIERCRRVSPRPNFIILLGNRYGWHPLPEEIPADEYEKVEPRVEDDEALVLLHQWYKRDNNAVPPVYCLRPRTDEFEDYEIWKEQVERTLDQALRQAVAGRELSEEARLKYEASATEQEIHRGALWIPDAEEHVFAFFREIQGLPRNMSAKDFTDLEHHDRLDTEAQGRLRVLKERIRAKIGEENVFRYEANWTGGSISERHLDVLCEDVYENLARVIVSQIERFESLEPLEEETQQHDSFGEERARFFVGRVEPLKRIAEYLNANNSHPLAVWGESGSGKSALMAKAVEQVRQNRPNAHKIVRFIGATPDSANGRALLERLCHEVSDLYGADSSNIPLEYKNLVTEFPKRLALATAEAPLIVFLDALDQLSDADNARSLVWLPRELPEHVRLVVSTLPGECLKALEGKLPESNRVELEPMPPQQGATLLDQWLRDAKRTLQTDQRAEVLNKCNQCGLPFYLKLVFEEARGWRSYDGVPDLRSGVEGILHNLFERLSHPANHGPLLVSRALGFLRCAKNGLTEDELLEVLARDEEYFQYFLHHASRDFPEFVVSPLGDQESSTDDADFVDHSQSVQSADHTLRRLPVVIWSRLYHDLESYLTERAADGTSLLDFYHRQLGEAVNREFLGENERRDRHARLACYFGDRPLWMGAPFASPPNLRKTSGLPFQQAHAGMSDELESTLTSFEFLQAKVEAAGPQPLIENYDLANAGRNEPLGLIQTAIRLSSHVLAHDGAQLAPQLHGRLAGDETPGIRSLLDAARQPTPCWLRPLQVCFDPPGGAIMQTLEGHTDWVSSVAITPDGQRALSASNDTTLKIWDLESGYLLTSLIAGDRMRSCAVAPDGRTIVAGDSYGRV